MVTRRQHQALGLKAPPLEEMDMTSRRKAISNPQVSSIPKPSGRPRGRPSGALSKKRKRRSARFTAVKKHKNVSRTVQAKVEREESDEESDIDSNEDHYDYNGIMEVGAEFNDDEANELEGDEDIDENSITEDDDTHETSNLIPTPQAWIVTHDPPRSVQHACREMRNEYLLLWEAQNHMEREMALLNDRIATIGRAGFLIYGAFWVGVSLLGILT